VSEREVRVCAERMILLGVPRETMRVLFIDVYYGARTVITVHCPRAVHHEREAVVENAMLIPTVFFTFYHDCVRCRRACR